MTLSTAPVMPLWLIAALVLIAVLLRTAAFVASRGRNSSHGRGPWLRFGAGILAVLCLGIAATRIGDESQAQQPPRPTGTADEMNINVFMVVDRSYSMGVFDTDTDLEFQDRVTRIVAVTRDIDVIVRKYPTARFAMISYADSARDEWPLSPDVWSFIPFATKLTMYGGDRVTHGYKDGDGVKPSTMVSAPAELLREKLNLATHNYPGSANLVYVFGAQSDPGTWTLDVPKGQVSGGAVFGYGTVEGEYGPGADWSERVHYALNEPAMRAAADSLGVPFLQRAAGVLSPDELPAIVPPAAPVDEIIPSVPHPNRGEYYWFFAGVAAVLFGLETYDLIRYWLRRRGATK